MSINWVMLADPSGVADLGGYVPLPGEQTLYKSPPRTTLSLQSTPKNPPKNSFSVQSKAGCVYLTNRRVIYLPERPTVQLHSFAVPVLNVQDSRVAAPWFGANRWEAVIQPVQGGGIPGEHAQLELVMEFKDGGAFDFSTTFERLKERLRQAVDVARESGLATGDGAEGGDARGGGALAGVNLDSVHLDELPAYEESQHHDRVEPVPAQPSLSSPTPVRSHARAPPSPPPAHDPSLVASPQQDAFPPDEPPPGYEEVQRESIVDELERQLRIHD